MTFLLNIIPILISAIGIGFVAFFQYKKRSIKGIIVSTIVACAALAVYQGVQPSYIPKTGVPPMVRLEIEEPKDLQIEDRLLKPQLSTKEREERLDEITTVRSQVKEILESPSTSK